MILRDNHVINFLLLFLLFIPTSPILGGYYTWFFLFSGVVLLFLLVKRQIIDISSHLPLLLYIILSFLFLYISLVLAPSQSVGDYNEFIRLLIYLLLYLCFYANLPKKQYEFEEQITQIVKILKYFIVIQFVAVLLQSNSSILNLMGIIWNMEKYWSMRSIGTFDNPNTLSILVSISFSVIYFKEKSKIISLVFLFISLIIVLFSGSRTGLISFVGLLCINYIFMQRITLKRILIIAIIALLSIVSLITFLNYYGDNFKYMAEILLMFNNDGFDSTGVGTLGLRQQLWENALLQFSKVSDLRYLFGVGPSKETSLHILDNDYITIYVKMGIIGSLLNIVFFIACLVYFLKNRSYVFSKLMVTIFILFAISAYTGPTFTSWYLALFYFIFYAFAIKEINLSNDNNYNSNL